MIVRRVVRIRFESLVMAGLLAAAGGVAAAPAGDAPGGTWMAEVQRAIRESEYHVSRQDGTVLPELAAAWQAPNRAQNLRFFFTDDGLRVVDRTAEGSPELLRLAVVGIGREGSLREPDPSDVVVAADAGRLDLRRPGLTETYRNGPAGLVHRVEIPAPPAGRGPLELVLSWRAAGLRIEGATLVLTAATGRRLCGRMTATDAVGRALPVSLAAGDDGNVVIAVADDGAAYPIGIENLLTGLANTQIEGNVDGIKFGFSGATNGDINGDGYADVVVGAPGWDGGETDEGAIFVFHGGPAGIANNLTAPVSDAADAVIETDLVGASWPGSVAIAGDLNGDGYDDIVVGNALWDPVNPPAASEGWGAAWVFHGSSSGLAATTASQADAIVVSDVSFASFGYTVAAAGDVNGDGFGDLAVGAHYWSDDSISQHEEGAAFVFHGSTAGIVAATIADADAVLEGNTEGIRAGTTVAGLGDVNGDGFDDVAIGIPFLTHPEPNEGGVVVVYGGPAGIASNPTEPLADAAGTLVESNGETWLLGLTIDGPGDVDGDGYADLLCGVRDWSDDPAQPFEGLVVMLHGGPSGVASNGATPLVDAVATAIAGNRDQTWSFGNRVHGAGDLNGDGFADIAAAPGGFSDGETDEGALFVFFGRAAGIPSSLAQPVEAVADIVIEGDEDHLYLGTAFFGGGDVNGDGFSDLVVGAPRHSHGQTLEGEVLIFHGAGRGPRLEQDWSVYGGQSGASLGTSVASVGDVNGDGYGDIGVGASGYDSGGGETGRVLVFGGSALGVQATPLWSADGGQVNEQFGETIASAGDVNGDGFSDVIVSAPSFDGGETDQGRLVLYRGSSSGLEAEPVWEFTSDLPSAFLGRSVAGGADVNGDGFSDVVAGSNGYSNGQPSEGRVWLFLGWAGGLSAEPPWTWESDVADAQLGASVACAGDVNGDGFGDLIVGAPRYTGGETEEGKAWVFHGSPAGPGPVPDWMVEPDRIEAGFGWSVASAGDIDGDGFNDVAVGAPGDSHPELYEGRVYLFHGSTTGLAASAARILEVDRASGLFGSCVAAAGDINGDGFSDLLVGAQSDNAAQNQGRACAFLGSAAGVAAEPAWVIAGTFQDEFVGYSVATAGDVNGDGFSDVVVGAPGHFDQQTWEGAAWVYLGNSGSGRPVLASQLRGDGDPTPVPPWGLSRSGDDFQVRLRATSPRGRELAKLHVEACPPGVAFADTACHHVVSADWTEIPATADGAELTETVAGLIEGELYRWRAHVLYAPLHADAPGITPPPNPRRGPWRTLSGQAPAADIRVGEPQEVTVSFVAAASAAAEGQLQVSAGIVVHTSDTVATRLPLSVAYLTQEGTATDGADYVGAGGLIELPMGTADGTVVPVLVDLIDDTLDEPEEKFGIELHDPVGAVIGVHGLHEATIVDDDPEPALSAADVVVAEGAGTAHVVLQLSVVSGFVVEVHYATQDGTAVAGEDYAPVSGVAVIAPSASATEVVIPIVSDNDDEPDEEFVLALWNPDHAVLLTPVAAVTIIDDDLPPIFVDGFESGNTSAWSAATP